MRFPDYIFALLGKHKTDGRDNVIANIFTGYPDYEWCKGKIIVCINDNGEFGEVPSDICADVASIIDALSEEVRA